MSCPRDLRYCRRAATSACAALLLNSVPWPMHGLRAEFASGWGLAARWPTLGDLCGSCSPANGESHE